MIDLALIELGVAAGSVNLATIDMGYVAPIEAHDFNDDFNDDFIH